MKRAIAASLVAAVVLPAMLAQTSEASPKRLCKETTHSKVKSASHLGKNAPVAWGLVSFRWCEWNPAGKYTGNVVSYAGPLSTARITQWGKNNNWKYEGGRQLVKCVARTPVGCAYVRVKVWMEFERAGLGITGLFGDHHTMKFSLLVGHGLELWR